MNDFINNNNYFGSEILGFYYHIFSHSQEYFPYVRYKYFKKYKYSQYNMRKTDDKHPQPKSKLLIPKKFKRLSNEPNLSMPKKFKRLLN